MKAMQTTLPGVLVIEPKRFGDHRGYFCETWNKARFLEAGIEVEFVQDNQSVSLEKSTLRGLHFQAPPYEQAKLVRCGRGALFDVAVDIRHGSPNFGRSFGIELTPENGKQLFVPRGFAHGFVTLQPETEILYKCDNLYAGEASYSIAFDDPALAINWGVDRDEAILSDADQIAGPLAALPPYFLFDGPAS